MNEEDTQSEAAATPQAKVKLRSVLMPGEHGAWAALVESLLMGMLAGLCWQAAYVGGTAVVMGLCVQPFKIVAKGASNRYQKPRVAAAGKALAIFAPVAIFLIMFGTFSPLIEPSFMLPLMVAIPLVVVQWYYDAQGKARALPGVLSGMVALAMVGPAMLLGVYTEYRLACAIFLILAARQISSVMYTRYLIRNQKGLPASVWGVIAGHKVAAVLVVLVYVVYPSAGAMIWLIIGGFIGLCIRAAVMLRLRQEGRVFKAKTIGLSELGIGLAYVVLTGLAMHLTKV